MDLFELLKTMVCRNASDLFLSGADLGRKAWK